MQIEAPDHLSATDITGYLAETQQPAEVGLSVTYPFTPSSVWPTAQIIRADVRGPYATGIRLEQCWNADLERCFINGDLGSEAEYANPKQMRVGIDLVGTMDANIDKCRVTAAGIGIRARTHPSGFPRCEGLEIDKSFLMHVNTGIELTGSWLGGWPTPSVELSPRHIAFNEFAIRATDQAFLNIHDVNCYATHYRRRQWCLYLVRCREVTIADNDYWCNWPPDDPGFFGGIVLDDCTNVTIRGGTFIGNMSIALHATKSCRNVRTEGKVWDELTAQGKVANYASG